MAMRTLSHLGDSTNRCFFTTLKYFEFKLHTPNRWIQYKDFKRFRNLSRNTKTPFSNVHIKSNSVNTPKLWKSLGFTVVFSGAAFVGTTIWEYERVREQAVNKYSRRQQIQITRFGWRGEMQRWWNNLRDGEKLFVPILFLNALVFCAWRMPNLQRTMLKYFSSSPFANTSHWAMVLTTFSHNSLPHLIANMYVLYTFTNIAVGMLGKEQFLFLYLTSGVVSTFTSYLYKTVRGIKIPSVGASGAIMGILGFTCAEQPDLRLSIIFLTMFSFTASTAINALICIDVMGCIFGWKFIDHAAHLGGLFFGKFWHAWGSTNMWNKRLPIVKFWHNLRGQDKSR